jgi:SAM-dependent methyltransferase/glycosyltransferase involved in cell wall biosynthesis
MEMDRLIPQCRICKSSNVVPLVETPSLAYPGTVCRFFTCNDCETILEEWSQVVTYKESPALSQSDSADSALRFYVEVGAGIDFIARAIVCLNQIQAQRGGERPRFLDIGSGVGFSCSMAEFQGWEAVGVEPSRMGVFGSQLLGVSIRNTYLEDADLPKGHFDYAYSSEVIEHVDDVDRFVATAAAYLKPDGILMLTTPNSQAARGGEAAEKEWLEVLAPGYHVNILSPASLEMVLRRNGMATVHIFLSEGTSGRKRMVALASRAPSIPLPAASWQELNVGPFVRSYLQHLIAEREKAGQDDAVYRGALYRLVEQLINTSAYAEAEAAAAKLDQSLARDGMPIESYERVRADTLAQYLNQAPAFAGLYIYYKGLLCLNYQRDCDGAAQWFRIAQHLCTLEGTVEGSNPWYLRSTWPERCRFHRGLAFLYGGRKREALCEFDALLAEPHKLPDGVHDQLLWSKAVAHLQLGENVQAARYFADTWLHRRFLDSSHQLLPLLHMTMALAQAGDNGEAKLRAVEERVQEHLANHFARSQQAQQRIEGELEHLHHRLDAVAGHLRPFWRLARPVASSFLSLARKGRSGYRWLRRGARAGVRIARTAVGLPTAQAYVPPTTPVETPLDELLAGHTIEQSFRCAQDDLSGLAIKFSTCHRDLTSSLHLAVCDSAGRRLREVRTSARCFRDNHLHCLTFPPLAESRGKEFTLQLTTPDAAAGNGVVLWTRPGPHSGLRFDRRIHDDGLIFEPVYASSTAAAPGGQRDLLLVCPDRLGRIRIGLGMRHWEIARALTARGLSVTLATPHRFDADLRGDGFPLIHVASNQAMLGLAAGHRSVLIQGDILDQFPALRDSNVPLAVDMITPMHLENLERSPADYEHARKLLVEALMRGDFFVCGNERQRLHWLGMLAGLGRLPFQARTEHPELRRLIDLVPFGIPDAPAVKSRPVLKGVRAGIGPDDFVLTWFGGIWDWLEPLPIVRAVAAAWRQDARIKLFFSAYRRPDGVVPNAAQRVRDLAEQLGVLERCVFFNDYPVPFDERADYLLETDAGILCQASNLETQVAARTRVLDYLWADCPLLVNSGDEWAQDIGQRELGVVVEENRADLWTKAILELCRDADGRARMRANIARLKQQLRWTACVEPLVQFVARQRPAVPASQLAA